MGLAALGSVTAVEWPKTGHSHATPVTKQPAQTIATPSAVYISRRERDKLFDIAVAFVQTAVNRKHLDRAWKMLGPEMRVGETRKSFDTGFNDVVPFPATRIQAWSILFAFKRDVAIDMSLVAIKGKTWAGKTFTIELKQYPSAPHRWLVASWIPKGVGGGGTLNPDNGPAPPPFHPAESPAWLLAPLVFFGGLLAFVLGLATRNILRSRRAANRYARALGYK